MSEELKSIIGSIGLLALLVGWVYLSYQVLKGNKK